MLLRRQWPRHYNNKPWITHPQYFTMWTPCLLILKGTARKKETWTEEIDSLFPKILYGISEQPPLGTVSTIPGKLSLPREAEKSQQFLTVWQMSHVTHSTCQNHSDYLPWKASFWERIPTWCNINLSCHFRVLTCPVSLVSKTITRFLKSYASIPSFLLLLSLL